MDALQDIPKIESPLVTEKGNAVLQKTDIFRKLMWFGYDGENTWLPVNVERVNEILRLNMEGKKPASLEEDEAPIKESVQSLNSDLTRMDKKFSGKAKRRKNKNRNKNRGGDNNIRRNQNRSGDKQ
jgi:hypothetical protein